MRRAVSWLAVVAALTGWAPIAEAQVPASITNVVDGDTVDASLADGRIVRVRVIGIDTPEVGECGFDEASAYMQQLALGQHVSLIGDPTQGEIDRYGRSLFYLDRDDGADLGEEMVRAGWAPVYVFDQPFERLASYRDAAEEAEGFERGVWARCDGQFHRSPADVRRAKLRRG